MSVASLSQESQRLKEDIADRIRRRIEYRKMTQKEIARKLDLPEQTFNRWVTGQTVIDSVEIPRIANALDVSVNYLYGEESDEELEDRKILYELRELTPAQKIAAMAIIKSLAVAGTR